MVIEIKELTKKYGRKEVLRGISLQLETDTYGLVGPNGAGKTTLLRLLANVQKPSRGEIFFDEESMRSGRSNGSACLNCFVNRNRFAGKTVEVGYLPQKFGCFPELTVYEQMKYFACLKGVEPRKQNGEILRLLEAVHLEEKAETKCRKLSGGMVRRLGIAQALFGTPRLLLLDEPTVGLDPEERNHFNEIIRRLEGRLIIVLSTHLIEDVRNLCGRLIVMDSGRVLMAGELEQITEAARGRVYEVTKAELEKLKCPFLVRNSVRKSGTELFRVILMGENREMKNRHPCEAEIEDGYLALLKGKEPLNEKSL